MIIIVFIVFNQVSMKVADEIIHNSWAIKKKK